MGQTSGSTPSSTGAATHPRLSGARCADLVSVAEQWYSEAEWPREYLDQGGFGRIASALADRMLEKAQNLTPALLQQQYLSELEAHVTQRALRHQLHEPGGHLTRETLARIADAEPAAVIPSIARSQDVQCFTCMTFGLPDGYCGKPCKYRA